MEHPIYRIIHIFGLSLQSKFLQDVITTTEYNIPHNRDLNLFHPSYKVLKENNIRIGIYDSLFENKEIMIDFSKDLIFSFPWSNTRFIDAVSSIGREEWAFDKLNHQAYFLEPFKIGIIQNGYHSSSVGILNKKGTLPAKVQDLSCLFDLFETDGEYYIYKETRKKLNKVYCFEEAVIFAIGALIHSYKLCAKG